jgi:hypothetical protein
MSSRKEYMFRITDIDYSHGLIWVQDENFGIHVATWTGILDAGLGDYAIFHAIRLHPDAKFKYVSLAEDCTQDGKYERPAPFRKSHLSDAEVKRRWAEDRKLDKLMREHPEEYSRMFREGVQRLNWLLDNVANTDAIDREVDTYMKTGKKTRAMEILSKVKKPTL